MASEGAESTASWTLKEAKALTAMKEGQDELLLQTFGLLVSPRLQHSPSSSKAPPNPRMGLQPKPVGPIILSKASLTPLPTVVSKGEANARVGERDAEGDDPADEGIHWSK